MQLWFVMSQQPHCCSCHCLISPCILDGPVIENMGADANFTVGQPGLLNCSVRGFPLPIITWTKNDQLVSISESGRVQILEDGALYFTSVNLMDAGLYMCVATSPHNDNADRSDEIMVEVFSKST